MINALTRVAVLGLNLSGVRKIGTFEIHGIPFSFPKSIKFSFRPLIRDGVSAIDYQRAVLKAEFIDELYRNKDPHYMSTCDSLISKLKEFEIIIFSTSCFIHPEILNEKLRSQVKVLGFTDDPHSTYVRGIPYLWAFDAAYYISPSYSTRMSFAELFQRLNFTKVRWLPLVQPISYPTLTLDAIKNRSKLVAYVGCPTGSKVDRLKKLNDSFGSDFELYGRWRFGGYYGFVRTLLGESPFLRKVNQISANNKAVLYLDTKMGFNMHVSDQPSECGNMRTYETAGFGMMPICDRGALNLQNKIFEEGKEAVYYSSIEEAVELIRYFNINNDERSKVAYSAYKRTCSEYTWEKTMKEFLEWL